MNAFEYVAMGFADGVVRDAEQHRNVRSRAVGVFLAKDMDRERDCSR